MIGDSIYPGSNGFEDSYYSGLMRNMGGDLRSAQAPEMEAVSGTVQETIAHVYLGPEGPGELYGDGPTGDISVRGFNADGTAVDMSLLCTTYSAMVA